MRFSALPFVVLAFPFFEECSTPAVVQHVAPLGGVQVVQVAEPAPALQQPGEVTFLLADATTPQPETSLKN